MALDSRKGMGNKNVGLSCHGVEDSWMTGAALRRRAKQAKRATTSSSGCKDAEISRNRRTEKQYCERCFKGVK